MPSTPTSGTPSVSMHFFFNPLQKVGCSFAWFQRLPAANAVHGNPAKESFSGRSFGDKQCSFYILSMSSLTTGLKKLPQAMRLLQLLG